MLQRCSKVMLANGQVAPLDDRTRTYLEQSIIQTMAHASFRTMTIAYRDFPSYIPEYDDVDRAPEDDMTLVAIVGIQVYSCAV